MSILHPAPLTQKPLIRQMMDDYLSELQAMEGPSREAFPPPEYPWLSLYWEEEDRHPFIIFADVEPAGFVLVNSHTHLSESEWAMAEFYVCPPYRRKGFGRKAAVDAFCRFPGKWEVYERDFNETARRFWRKIIGEYTHGIFKEVFLESEDWRGHIQSFNSRGRRK